MLRETAVDVKREFVLAVGPGWVTAQGHPAVPRKDFGSVAALDDGIEVCAELPGRNETTLGVEVRCAREVLGAGNVAGNGIEHKSAMEMEPFT